MRKVHLSFKVDHYNRAWSLGRGHEQRVSNRHGNRPRLPLRKELGVCGGDGGDAAMAAAAGGRTQVTVVVVGGEGVERRRGDRSIRDEVDEGHRESPSSHRLAFDVAQL